MNNAEPQRLPSENLQPVSRRSALIRSAAAMAGLAGMSLVLSGCSSSGSNRAMASSGQTVVPPDSSPKNRNSLLDRWGPGSGDRTRESVTRDSAPRWQQPAQPSAPQFDYLVRRSEWAKGQPVPSLMDRMLPIDKITVHHDGMSPFMNTTQAAAATRIEAIRRAHRNNNWGDIGYHYLVDPYGRVWEGRPLNWQGAHVRNNNEGNIGICVLGNYEEQAVNERQMSALERLIASNMRAYRVPRNRVYTHQEFNSTACPGRSLQARMNAVRASRSSELNLV